MNQKVLAIDPGVTTGVALLDEDGEVVMTLCFPWVNAEREMSQISKDYEIDHVVMEDHPSIGRQHFHEVDYVERVAYDTFAGIEFTTVRPADWKGHPRSSCASVPACVTQHERDACRLGTYGRWFIQRKEQ